MTMNSLDDIKAAIQRLTAQERQTLPAKAHADDPIDATVVEVARSGDRILTSDPDDIGRLVSSSGKRVAVVPC